MPDRQDEVASRLHSSAIRLLRRLRAEDRHSGLSPARLSILSVLIYSGPQTATSLAEIEQLRLPTVSRLLSGMEADGLVRRKQDSRDARASWVHATSKGKQVLEKARTRRLARLNAMLESLEPEERRTLRDAISVIECMLEA